MSSRMILFVMERVTRLIRPSYSVDTFARAREIVFAIETHIFRYRVLRAKNSELSEMSHIQYLIVE